VDALFYDLFMKLHAHFGCATPTPPQNETTLKIGKSIRWPLFLCAENNATFLIKLCLWLSTKT